MSRATEAIRAAVIADYATGMSSLEAARKHDVAPSSAGRWIRQAGIARSLSESKKNACKVDGCLAKHCARGYCNAHYKREIARADIERRSPPIHIEDVEWMAETGETWFLAAERLGVKENTLLRHLERAGRYDLVRKLQRREVAA